MAFGHDGGIVTFGRGRAPPLRTVYRPCTLSLTCHSEGAKRPWESVPFSYQRQPWPPPTFAAPRQRRDLIIANPRRVFPKREGRSPPSLVAQGWGIFKGEGRSKLPSPLNGVLWILSFAKERKYPTGGIPRRGAELPCLSGKKVTRRRQKRKKPSGGAEPRPYARFFGGRFVGGDAHIAPPFYHRTPCDRP